MNPKTRFRELHNVNMKEQMPWSFDKAEPAYIVPMPKPNRQKRSILSKQDRKEMTPAQFEYRELTRVKPHLALDPDAGMTNVRLPGPMPGHNLELEMHSLTKQGFVDDDPDDGYDPREALLIAKLRDEGIISPFDKHILPEEEFDNSEFSARKLKPIFITTYERVVRDFRPQLASKDKTTLPIPPNYHARTNEIEQHLPEELLRERTANGTTYPPAEPKPNFELYEPLPTPKGYTSSGVRPLGAAATSGGCQTCPFTQAAFALVFLGLVALIYMNFSGGQKLMRDGVQSYPHTRF
jgi:hypothetical protein